MSNASKSAGIDGLSIEETHIGHSADSASNLSSETDLDSLLNIHQHLSPSTLEALLQFLEPSTTLESMQEDNFDESIACIAYTDNDRKVIEETLERLSAASTKKETFVRASIQDRTLIDLEYSLIEDASTVLARDGVVRLDSILSSSLCISCLDAINKHLALCVLNGTDIHTNDINTDMFGNVYSRDHRWDMYLDNSVDTPYITSLVHMLGKETTQLSQLLNKLFQHKDFAFHELSALISDKGALNQPIHPDSKFLDNCPLYTVFVALQDVDAAMGPTIFLPQSQTRERHNKLFNESTKDEFLSSSIYSQALLRRGDAVIMDARTLHCGSANTLKRRVLLYFTLRSPQFYDEAHVGVFFGKGSIAPHLNISQKNFTN